MLAAFTATLIWIRHSANIGRLLRGREPRIGAKAA
jgi:glycerol-3-phosphate acyltransferase PlsY